MQFSALSSFADTQLRVLVYQDGIGIKMGFQGRPFNVNYSGNQS